MDRATGQSESDAAYCAALVRAEDRDRFLAAQFASPAGRARLLALLAVNAEIARAPRTAREPLLAEMRLQWWLDAVSAALAGSPPPRQPALAAFARAVRDSGSTAGRIAAAFESLIAASARDTRTDPLRDAADAERHADALSGTIADAALALLGVADETARRAARSAGIAYALVGLGIAGDKPAHGIIRNHIAAARAETRSVPRAALPVLLWATAADIRLRRLARGKTRPSPWLPLQLAWRGWRARY
jgi:hypothetical protein